MANLKKVTKAQVLAWLDERGWPHDPYEMSKDQNLEMRRTLKICGHRTRSHTPCVQAPGLSGRCKHAGDASPRGIASPAYRGKGRSRYVADRWRDRYEELRKADSELMDLTHVLTMLALREEMLARRVDPAETGRTWKALRQECAGLQRALKVPVDEGGQEMVRERVMAINELIAQGSSDTDAWEEMAKVWDQTRRTVDTETKRRVLYRLVIKAEDAMEDYDALANAVKETVDDAVRQGLIPKRAGDRILIDVSERFARLVALPALSAA